MFCSNCGRENNGEAKFCAGCGTKIGKVSSFVEHTVDKYKDNEVNDRLIRIIKTIFNVGSIIVIICFVIALFCGNHIGIYNIDFCQLGRWQDFSV